MNKQQKIRCLLFFTLVVALFSPPGRLLEQNMVSHVLIQIPLLVVSGILLASLLVNRLKIIQDFNDQGIPGILLAIFVSLYWMLPRALDASITDTTVMWVKYLSLPLLVGLPLMLSWGRLHSVAKGLVKVEFLAMLLRLGWLYLISPVRLCNLYGLKEQILLGKGLLVIALVLAVYWTANLFFSNHSAEKEYLQNLSNKLV